ncbi:MAG: hypothetical protein ACRD47_13440 [Nitrososphaeraceae archaeon]
MEIIDLRLKRRVNSQVKLDLLPHHSTTVPTCSDGILRLMCRRILTCFRSKPIPVLAEELAKQIQHPTYKLVILSITMSGTEFEVIPRNMPYHGLSYEQLAELWMNWLISPDPDSNNSGPFIFLRGVDRITGENQTIVGEQYSFNYLRIEPDELRILNTDTLFWPIIMYYVDERHNENADTYQKRWRHAMAHMLAGDNPPKPSQARIRKDGGNAIDIVSNFTNFGVITNDFDLYVPSSSYVNRLGPILDVPLIHEGIWKCVVAGYFLLIRIKDEGKYTIMSNGNGEEGYHTETYVEVQVYDSTKKNDLERDSLLNRAQKLLKNNNSTKDSITEKTSSMKSIFP